MSTFEATAVPATTTPELVTLWQTANAMAASGKYDAAYTPEEAFARILAGRDLGLSPSDSMVHVHWLEGQFKPSAQVQGALLKAYVGPDGERYDYRALRADDSCYVWVKRREQGGEWEDVGEVQFTMEDARRAELHDSSDFWRKHPRRMLFWRALSEAIEAYAPQVVHPVSLPATIAFEPGGEVAGADELPAPAGNPAQLARGEDDAHPETAGGWLALFTRIVKEHDKHGRLGRVVEVLDAAGAPDGETLEQRFVGLETGDRAHEVIHRLDRHRASRRAQQRGGSQ